MLTKTPLTPLSTSANSFTPKSDMSSSCRCSDSSQTVVWVPVIVMNILQAVAPPDYAPNALHSCGGMPRGRTRNKESKQRSFSRTPSPSGWSMSPSDVSTAAESTPTQTGSSDSAERFEVALFSHVDDSIEKQDLVVKNTFVTVEDSSRMEQSKLFRNASAPSILLSCPFKQKALTMLELHDSEKCSPCARFYGRKGCRSSIACNFCHMCSPKETQIPVNARKAWTRPKLLKAGRDSKARQAKISRQEGLG